MWPFPWQLKFPEQRNPCLKVPLLSAACNTENCLEIWYEIFPDLMLFIKMSKILGLSMSQSSNYLTPTPVCCRKEASGQYRTREQELSSETRAREGPRPSLTWSSRCLGPLSVILASPRGPGWLFIHSSPSANTFWMNESLAHSNWSLCHLLASQGTASYLCFAQCFFLFHTVNP